MKNKSIVVSLFAFLFSLFAIPAFADVVCQPIYGGGQSCVQAGNILINKTVMNPSTSVLVDNLSVNDPKYGPDFIVNFQLVVTNTGSSTLSKVEVKDIFPQYVKFSSGPGTFDSNTNTLTFTVENLAASESRTFNIQGKVVSANDLPNQTVCVVNQAIATSDKQSSQDNAQLCIEKAVPTPIPAGPITTKGGLPVMPPAKVVTTPPTGPEALALAALIPTGILGQFLRKRASK